VRKDDLLNGGSETQPGRETKAVAGCVVRGNESDESVTLTSVADDDLVETVLTVREAILLAYVLLDAAVAVSVTADEIQVASGGTNA
jgi:hypothetical protein